LKHPYRKGEEVGLSRYFKLKTYRQILYALPYALSLLAILILLGYNLLISNSDYLNWSSSEPADQTYILNVSGSNINKELVLELYYEPTGTKFRKQNIMLANRADTFSYTVASFTDTSAYGLLRISQTDGTYIREDSFKLNSNVYTYPY
jgi:hypothetical protein